MKSDLEQHYLDTIYFVHLAGKQYGIKIDEDNLPVINNLFATENASTAAILTAWNPRSQAIDFAQNKIRNYDLYHYLKKNNYVFYDALGKGKDPLWPAEEGYIVLGLNKEEAEKLAVHYEQNAFVWLEKNKLVSLEYTSIWHE
ncbi:MAG: DUF3293 domain-containing protein [Gammaproteobacteria bacterium]|nr:DUF3293 domain-containing protein [Gammaproteobacteria bacterium]